MPLVAHCANCSLRPCILSRGGAASATETQHLSRVPQTRTASPPPPRTPAPSPSAAQFRSVVVRAGRRRGKCVRPRHRTTPRPPATSPPRWRRPTSTSPATAESSRTKGECSGAPTEDGGGFRSPRWRPGLTGVPGGRPCFVSEMAVERERGRFGVRFGGKEGWSSLGVLRGSVGGCGGRRRCSRVVAAADRFVFEVRFGGSPGRNRMSSCQLRWSGVEFVLQSVFILFGNGA